MLRASTSLRSSPILFGFPDPDWCIRTVNKPWVIMRVYPSHPRIIWLMQGDHPSFYVQGADWISGIVVHETLHCVLDTIGEDEASHKLDNLMRGGDTEYGIGAWILKHYLGLKLYQLN